MPSEVQAFADLGLADPLIRAINDTGYTAPTQIQEQAIPKVLDGGDLLAAAQTGTGKTAGFTLPVLHRLIGNPIAKRRSGTPRCLVLVPTRELAIQVDESVKTYSKHVPIRTELVFGGVSINRQIAALKKPVDILIATPGRLLDLVGQHHIHLSKIEILVLDEADRMLDMGFIRDMKRIIALLPKTRQTLLFSATFSNEIRTLATTFLTNPREVSVARRNTASELVDQSVYWVDKPKKRALVTHLITEHQWSQVLIFTKTKHGANRLAMQLNKDGITADAIHGNKSQTARTRALSAFKSGTVQVLVATDIAARGLDIKALPHVINYELPHVAEDYVHRIGRTGRAGATGTAVSLVDANELPLLKAIERVIKRAIPTVELDGHTGHDIAASAPEKNTRSKKRSSNTRKKRTQSTQGNNRQAGKQGTQGRSESGNQPAAHGAKKKRSRTRRRKPSAAQRDN